MKIRERLWILENRINYIRVVFWRKVEKLALNKQEKILYNNLVFPKENEHKLIELKRNGSV